MVRALNNSNFVMARNNMNHAIVKHHFSLQLKHYLCIDQLNEIVAKN
jgi:hypothetical protein